mmetsp:Transcript_11143/g.22475  ORF Transcript_11143/g.22475 Transcript_11143/m.22475 type:complete len:206 (-) Transcript_11143:284-901(-)
MLMVTLALSGLVPRCPPPRMGGLTGLPRIPQKALAMTKSFNPGGTYTEPIATLWRDLETLYGTEQIAGVGGSRSQMDARRYVDSGVSTNKFRGFTYNVDLRVEEVLKAVKKTPSLLNPAVSNRFVLARSKAILVETLGSQSAALEVMKQDPSILQDADALESMSAGAIKSRVLGKQLLGIAPVAVVLVAVALAANEQGVVLDGLM